MRYHPLYRRGKRVRRTERERERKAEREKEGCQGKERENAEMVSKREKKGKDARGGGGC